MAKSTRSSFSRRDLLAGTAAVVPAAGLAAFGSAIATGSTLAGDLDHQRIVAISQRITPAERRAIADFMEGWFQPDHA